MTFLIYKKVLFSFFQPKQLSPSRSENSASYIPRPLASWYIYPPLFTSSLGDSCVISFDVFNDVIKRQVWSVVLTVFAVILVIKKYLCQQISAENVLQREHLGNLEFGKALNILFNSFCSNFSNQVARLFCCPFYRSMSRGFCILVRRRCVSARLLNAKPFSFSWNLPPNSSCIEVNLIT